MRAGDALNRAQAQRQAHARAADDSRDSALKQPGIEVPKIEQQYRRQIEQINQQYERERARILGFAWRAATQPASWWTAV